MFIVEGDTIVWQSHLIFFGTLFSCITLRRCIVDFLITKNIVKKIIGSGLIPPKIIQLQNAVGRIYKQNICWKIGMVGQDEKKKSISVGNSLGRKFSPMDLLSTIIAA